MKQLQKMRIHHRVICLFLMPLFCLTAAVAENSPLNDYSNKLKRAKDTLNRGKNFSRILQNVEQGLGAQKGRDANALNSQADQLERMGRQAEAAGDSQAAKSYFQRAGRLKQAAQQKRVQARQHQNKASRHGRQRDDYRKRERQAEKDAKRLTSDESFRGYEKKGSADSFTNHLKQKSGNRDQRRRSGRSLTYSNGRSSQGRSFSGRRDRGIDDDISLEEIEFDEKAFPSSPKQKSELQVTRLDDSKLMSELLESMEKGTTIPTDRRLRDDRAFRAELASLRGIISHLDSEHRAELDSYKADYASKKRPKANFRRRLLSPRKYSNLPKKGGRAVNRLLGAVRVFPKPAEARAVSMPFRGVRTKKRSGLMAFREALNKVNIPPVLSAALKRQNKGVGGSTRKAKNRKIRRRRFKSVRKVRPTTKQGVYVKAGKGKKRWHHGVVYNNGQTADIAPESYDPGVRSIRSYTIGNKKISRGRNRGVAAGATPPVDPTSDAYLKTFLKGIKSDIGHLSKKLK